MSLDSGNRSRDKLMYMQGTCCNSGVFLNPGSNMITITLKPEKEKDDTNPNNNSFTVEVILKP